MTNSGVGNTFPKSWDTFPVYVASLPVCDYSRGDGRIRSLPWFHALVVEVFRSSFSAVFYKQHIEEHVF